VVVLLTAFSQRSLIESARDAVSSRTSSSPFARVRSCQAGSDHVTANEERDAEVSQVEDKIETVRSSNEPRRC